MPHPDLRSFVDAMLLATRQAGAVALHLQGEVPARHKEHSGSPEAAALSIADLATQDVLLLALQRALPRVAVDAEEETEAVALFPPAGAHRPLVVLDPIDGSLNYLQGSADYAVMAGWMEDGRYRAAVVYFPAWEEMYWGVEGEGVWRERGGSTERIALGAAAGLPAPRGEAEAGGRAAGERDGDLPPVLVPPRLPAEAEAELARARLPLAVTRCSAVDSTGPVTGRGRGSLLFGQPGRRRSIGYFLTLAAGGIVEMGGRPWSGEDPYSVAPGRTLTAADQATASLLRAAAR